VKRTLLILLSAVIVIVPQAGTDTQTADWSVNVTTLASPAAANSAQPQLSTQGHRVTLSWIERYTVEGPTQSLRELRSLQDWFIRYQAPRFTLMRPAES
jgi:Cu/Ag efflux pump CusA